MPSLCSFRPAAPAARRRRRCWPPPTRPRSRCVRCWGAGAAICAMSGPASVPFVLRCLLQSFPRSSCSLLSLFPPQEDEELFHSEASAFKAAHRAAWERDLQVCGSSCSRQQQGCLMAGHIFAAASCVGLAGVYLPAPLPDPSCCALNLFCAPHCGCPAGEGSAGQDGGRPRGGGAADPGAPRRGVCRAQGEAGQRGRGAGACLPCQAWHDSSLVPLLFVHLGRS